MKKFHLPVVMVYLLLLNGWNSTSQNIAAYSGTSTPTSNSIDYISTTPLSFGPGVSSATGVVFIGRDWTNSSSIDTNDYIEWSITADPEFTVNISSLEINYDRSASVLGLIGAGPKKVTLKSSLDGYTTDLFTDTSVSSSSEINTISTNLTSAVGGTITFRLYGYDAKDLLAWLGLPTGTFNIENNLGTVLGTTDTGIIIKGSVVYDGLAYSSGSWTPEAPSSTTGAVNALVIDGTYTETGNVEINNLKIEDGATTEIAKTGSVTVNGDLTTSDDLILESDSENYSSLIVEGSVTGTAKYKRHVNSNAGLRGNDLISAPLTGETFGSFTSNNSNIVQNPSDVSQKLFGPFNKATGIYDFYDTDISAESNITLDPAIGYRAASTDNDTFTFTGAIETSTKTIAIYNSGAQFADWNLIGNPYPSYIKLSTFITENNSQFNTPNAGIYGYDGDASDGWEIWNKAYSDTHPNAMLTPGQGFLVSSKSDGGTITFTPSMRTIGNTDDFIANRSSTTANNGYLTLLLSSISDKNYSTTLYFNPNASLSMDKGYDATFYNNSAPDFAIYSRLVENSLGEDLAVQAVSFNDLNDVEIPIGINASQSEQITVSISENVTPEDTDVFLKDNLTNIITDLKAGDYTISPSTDLNGVGRFSIIFSRQEQLSISENNLNDLKVYTDKNTIFIIVDGQFSFQTKLLVYDIQGRIVKTKELDTKNTKHTIETQSLSSGAYIVQLQNSNKKRSVKIILN
ncbi:T9SS type A sorting domain-containing protein [Winogradskyella sp. PC D3.3]